MRDSPFWTGFVAGAISICILAFLPNSALNLYHDAIKECEMKLHRTQNCKIIGVPVVENAGAQHE